MIREFLSDPFTHRLLLLDATVFLTVLVASLAFIQPPTITTVVTLPFIVVSVVNIIGTIALMVQR